MDQGTDHQNSQALSYVTLASNPTHLSQTPHPICRVYNHRLWFPVEQPTQQSSNWNWLKSYHCVNSVIKENHWLYVQFPERQGMNDPTVSRPSNGQVNHKQRKSQKKDVTSKILVNDFFLKSHSGTVLNPSNLVPKKYVLKISSLI